MKRGILYFNQGEKCMVRLLVSLHSLRRHYDGPVTLLTVGPQCSWFLDAARMMQADIQEVTADPGIPPLVRKARLQEYSPYDTSMFLDADTLVLQPIAEYFDKVEEHGFCTGEFAGWRTTGGTISRRIRSFGRVVPEYVEAALAYGKATNTGVFGFRKDAPILPEWKDITEKGWRAACSPIPDEVGCQMLLPKYPHWLALVEWGTSVKFGAPERDIKIVHYHGRKHVHPFPLCNLWKQHYCALKHSLPPKLRKEFVKPWHDRRLKRYLKELREDITVVTAVNPRYVKKLEANFPLWMKTSGIYEYPMICYINGFDGPGDPRLDFIRARATLIEWALPEADTPRELMLSAFVLGAARDVKSAWWLKVDADATPQEGGYKDFQYTLAFPRQAWRCDIFGDKCGYTKSKQAQGGRHFLNVLDDWWAARTGEPPLFPADIPWRARHGHKRLRSYVCLHNAEFVRKYAEACGGRLPVPSHDTYLWYCAERGGHKWGSANFRGVMGS